MGAKVAIWGAGKFGRYVYDQIKDREDIEVQCFLDSNPNIAGEKIDQKSIFAPEQLQENSKILIDYILVSFLNGICIYSQLLQFDDIRVGIVKDRVFIDTLGFKKSLEDDSNIFWVDNNRPLLRAVETNVVDYCNLNCKGCSHFSNLYASGDKIPFDTYCNDLEQLSRKVNIQMFSILGGEALLNERIVEYIDFSRKALPYADILLITNGLLIPVQKEEFFLCCIRNNISIEITEYLPTSRMKDQIICILEKYGVRYRFREKIDTFMKNIDLSGTADKYYAMQHCLQNDCNFLRNGRIYKCPFEALGNRFFEHFQFDIRLAGGVDIYANDLDWQEMVSKLEKEPVDACRYCGKGEWFTWEWSNSPTAEEWLVDRG